MATARSVLKTYFESGKKPTQQQFEELIDALVHVNDNLATIIGALATVNEAQQGVATDKYMSAFLTKVAIQFQVGPHFQNSTNPHNVTKTQVGLGNLPNAKTNQYDVDDDNILATAEAVFKLFEYMNTSMQPKATAVKFYFTQGVSNPAVFIMGDVLFSDPGSGNYDNIYIHNGSVWKLIS